MVLPYLLHLAVFLGYPLAFAFVLIFHRWNIYTPMKWVGLGNIKLLLTDPLIWRALFNTLYFLLIHIPLQLVLALGLAQLLNQKIRGTSILPRKLLHAGRRFRRRGHDTLATDVRN